MYGFFINATPEERITVLGMIVILLAIAGILAFIKKKKKQ